MSDKTALRLLQAGLLVLGLSASCGGSSEPDARRSGSRSDANNDSSAEADAADGNTDTSDGNTDAGDGNTDTADGNTDTADGNTDTADGNTDTGDGNTDTGDGNTDTGDGNTAAAAGDESGDAGIDLGGGAGGSAGGSGAGVDDVGLGVGGASHDFGGSAGAPGTPDLTLPPGCRPQSPEETENLCRLVMECDTSPSVRTYCHRLDSGRWECQCAFHENLYQLENTAGLQACALAAELCSEPDLELGEEQCEPTTESSHPDDCRTELTCGRPIALETSTETQAWRVRIIDASCRRDGTGNTFGCTCQEDGATDRYTLRANGSDLACGPLADFCMSGATPEFIEEGACMLNSFMADSKTCNRVDDCGAQMPLTDDVSLLELQRRHATCGSLEGGGSKCSCGGLLFQLPTPANSTSCESSISICDPNAVIVPKDLLSCEPPSVRLSGGNQCDASLMCLVDATVDGQSVPFYGDVQIHCRRAETDMPWVCWFHSRQNSGDIDIEVGAGADPTQACTDASAAILELPDFHVSITNSG